MLVCRTCLNPPYYRLGECLECDDCNWFIDGETEQEAKLEAIANGLLTSENSQLIQKRESELAEGLCF